MKTKICAVMILLLSTLLTGCFAEETTDEIKIGMIRYLNASEENMNELIKKIEQKNGENLSNYSTVYYDTLNSMEMGLNAGNIAEMSTYRSVSNYITGHNSALVPAPIAFKLSDSFCCAFRQEDSALRDDFDKALKSMIDDGTLITLTSQYITNFSAGVEPQAIDMPRLNGVQTIKIAVTGDLPPLDLIKADGTPAGFNTAVLAEISKRINKNIELVSIESGARASALMSGVADVLFWARKPDDNSDLPSDIDQPDGIIFSTPYFSDKITHLKLK